MRLLVRYELRQEINIQFIPIGACAHDIVFLIKKLSKLKSLSLGRSSRLQGACTRVAVGGVDWG